LAERPRIHVLLDVASLSADVLQALGQVGAEVNVGDFTDGQAAVVAELCDARLIITADAHAITNGKLAKLHEWFDDAPCPTLVLSDAPAALAQEPHARVTNGRAIEFAARLSRDELVGRLHAMCALHRPMQALCRELTELRQTDGVLRADLTRLHDEIRLAGVLQRDLLRSSPPTANGVEIDVVYQPAEILSGDFYDVTRLDDNHMAFFLADATGHGMSAALLTTFVRRWLSGHGVRQGAERPVAPGELLAGLNRELLAAQLQDCHFLASIFAIYDERTRIMRWARGGTPYPILVRAGQPPHQVVSDGPLVGVSSDARFQLVEFQLEPGDTVIFHTDGLDALLASKESGLGCCDLHSTDWYRALGSRPIKRHLEEVDTRLGTRPSTDTLADDTTVIALHIQEQPTRVSHTTQGHRGRISATRVPVAV
jgi:hypothetical protein